MARKPTTPTASPPSTVPPPDVTGVGAPPSATAGAATAGGIGTYLGPVDAQGNPYKVPSVNLPIAGIPSGIVRAEGGPVMTGNLNGFGLPVRASPYNNGDEYAPLQDTPAEVLTLQSELVDAGYLSASGFSPKVWDAASAAALKKAMTDANFQQASVESLLSIRAQQRAAAGIGTSRSVKQPSVAFANPLDVSQSFANEAASLTGGGLPSGEEQSFLGSFRGQEKSAYAAYAKAGQDRALGLGGSYVGAPSADVSAKAYILGHNQQDVVNYDMALRTLQFKQALAEL